MRAGPEQMVSIRAIVRCSTVDSGATVETSSPLTPVALVALFPGRRRIMLNAAGTWEFILGRGCSGLLTGWQANLWMKLSSLLAVHRDLYNWGSFISSTWWQGRYKAGHTGLLEFQMIRVAGGGWINLGDGTPRKPQQPATKTCDPTVVLDVVGPIKGRRTGEQIADPAPAGGPTEILAPRRCPARL